jgi:GNAT superfamily N-acetyltransferase
MKIIDNGTLQGFIDNPELQILNSFYQGFTGSAVISDEKKSSPIIINVGDFFWISDGSFAERCEVIEKANSFISPLRIGSVFLPDYQPWENLLSQTFLIETTTRYAFKLIPPVMQKSDERQRVTILSQLRENGIRIYPLISDYIAKIDEEVLLRDVLNPLGGSGNFLKHGFGLCAVTEYGKIVGVIGSYVLYSDGVEIQIDVLPEWQGIGIGYALGLFFLSDCSSRGLYARWDAMDYPSAQLARKLGFRLEKEYSALRIVERL